MSKFLRLSCLTLIASLLIYCGCSKKPSDDPNSQQKSDPSSATKKVVASMQNTPQVNSDSEDVKGTVSIENIWALWKSNKKDELIKMFKSDDLKHTLVTGDMEVLNLSEGQLAKLEKVEQEQYKQEALKFSNSMRSLIFYVSSEAISLSNSGNTDQAKVILSNLCVYGDLLMDKNSLHVIQMHGKAAKAYAMKRLSELE